MISFLKRLAKALEPPPEEPLPPSSEPPPGDGPQPPPPRSHAEQIHDRAALALRSDGAVRYVAQSIPGDVQSLLEAGETGLAKALLVDALAVTPSAVLRAKLAEVLLLRGEIPLARPVLLALAQEQDPGHAHAAEMRLGQLAEDAGNTEGARRHFERAYAMRPDDGMSRDAARRLRDAEERDAPAGAGWLAMGRLWGQAGAGDGFTVHEEIGRGGSATLFRATDLGTHREVALKLIHPRGDPVLRRHRLLSEAALAARFQHPSIISILDVMPERDLMVMPFHKEGSLKMLLVNGPLPPAHAFTMAGELALALTVLHAADVAHLDIKPSNILLRHGLPVLADFGAAAARAAGQAAGTRPYLAPEALTGGADCRADLYALGVLLVECLTGTPSTTLHSLAQPNPSWTAGARHLVARLTETDPTRRLGDANIAADLCFTLAHVADGSSS